MKTAFGAVLLFFCLGTLPAQSVMSFNIRYNNPKDGFNAWEERKDEVTKLINYYHPDFLGIQEGLHDQVLFLDSSLADYQYSGVGRDDGKTRGEYAAIFYDSSRWHLIQENTYWLSESPNKVSVGWDASMERITSYGAFRNRETGDTIHIFNAHFDHIGEKARKGSAKLILTLLSEKELDEKPLVVMGDLNCSPEDTPIQILKTVLDDSWEISHHPPYGPSGTFNHFDANYTPDRRIDYIFTKNLKVDRVRIIEDRRRNSFWPSDHLPVFVSLGMQ